MARFDHIPVLMASSLFLGIGGCAHAPIMANFAKVKPIPVDLKPVDPGAAEDRLYARAVKAIQERDYGLALEALQYAKDARPDDPRVLTAMGVVYDKLGRFDLSGRYYDLAEKADPGSRIVAINRRYSEVLQQRKIPEVSSPAVMMAESGGAPATAAAIEMLRPADPIRIPSVPGGGMIKLADLRIAEPRETAPARAAERSPEPVRQAEFSEPARTGPAEGPPPTRIASGPTEDALYAHAVQRIGVQEYGVALGLLQRAHEMRADDPRVLSALGVVYDRLGRFDLSSRYYDLAEQADPGSRIVAVNRRFSKLLQAHGGAAGVTDVITIADAERAAPTPRPSVRTSHPARTALNDASSLLYRAEQVQGG